MMQTRLAISAVVLVLSAAASVQTATACSKEAVAGAVDRWTTVLAENNPDTIVALYSKDAVLWGTLSSTVRSDPAGLKAYFVGAFKRCRNSPSNSESSLSAYMEIPQSTRATTRYSTPRTAKPNRSPPATVSRS